MSRTLNFGLFLPKKGTKPWDKLINSNLISLDQIITDLQKRFIDTNIRYIDKVVRNQEGCETACGATELLVDTNRILTDLQIIQKSYEDKFGVEKDNILQGIKNASIPSLANPFLTDEIINGIINIGGFIVSGQETIPFSIDGAPILINGDFNTKDPSFLIAADKWTIFGNAVWGGQIKITDSPAG